MPVGQVVADVQDLLRTDAQETGEVDHRLGRRLRIVVEGVVPAHHGIELAEQRTKRPARVLEAPAGQDSRLKAHRADLLQGLDVARKWLRLVDELALALGGQIVDLGVDGLPFGTAPVGLQPKAYRRPEPLGPPAEVYIVEWYAMALQHRAVYVVQPVVVHVSPEEGAVHIESDGPVAPCHG